MKLLEPGMTRKFARTISEIDGVFRRCNGSCNRTLKFAGSERDTTVKLRCSVCKCDTNWFLVGGGV